MKVYGRLLSCLTAILIIAAGCARQPAVKAETAREFIDKTSDKQIETIVTDVFYLTHDTAEGFSDGDELSMAQVFNLYAATAEVQRKLDSLPGGDYYADFPISDFENFVKKYFGDYPFNLEQLSELKKNGRIKYDEAAGSISISAMNGGVLWPADRPYTVEITEKSADGDIATIRSIIKYTDTDAGEKVEMTLKLKTTAEGYQYQSCAFSKAE